MADKNADRHVKQPDPGVEIQLGAGGNAWQPKDTPSMETPSTPETDPAPAPPPPPPEGKSDG